jgi:acyl-CoA thioesterase
MSFAEDTAVTAVGPGSFRAELDPRWLSLVSIHGGYRAAILARAIEATVADPGKPLRTMAVQFAGVATPGPVDVEVEVERMGRSLTTTSARMRQHGKVIQVAHALSARPSGGPTYDELDRPRTAEPGEIPRFVPEGDVVHFQNVEVRMDPSVVPFGGGDIAWLAAWIRPHDREPIDAPWVVAVCDLLPPAVFTRTTAPVRAATLDYIVHLATGEPRLSDAEHVFLECHSPLAREGFAVENATMWAPDGTVLAMARQTRLAGGEPRPLGASGAQST